MFVPDVESYFPVGFMEDSRQVVERTIKQGEGISLVFGRSGTGKTLLLRLLQQSLESHCTVVLVSNSRLETTKALFLQISHDLHLSCTDSEAIDLRLKILNYVREETPQGVVLLFDESQHLSSSVLEEIRFLTDTSDGSPPLFRAVLAGTLDFEEKLTLPTLETFNQRVISRCYLDSFTGEETAQYIVGQTDDQRVAESLHPLFTESAKRLIHQFSEGIPRTINLLCRSALQFAAEKGKDIIDAILVNDAWISLQHIKPVVAEQTEEPVVQEPVFSPEQIAKIVEQKRSTFRIRKFEPVEFGTLTEAEPETEVEPESIFQAQSFQGNNYKPPYPEDDDDFAELVSVVDEEVFTPRRTLHLHVPVETDEHDADEGDTERVSLNAKPVSFPTCNIAPDFHKQERKFRRRYLLQKIQHRLGLFAGLLQKGMSRKTELPKNVSDMNSHSLQEYGAAVLEGRPQFVRKEPQYAYQTPEVPHDVTMCPDPMTGVPVALHWLPERSGEGERFGVSYTEFLNREKPQKEETNSEQPEAKAVPGCPESSEAPIVRTSLHASLGNRDMPIRCLGLEEAFEESRQVGGLAISLAELFRTKSSALRQIETSSEFKSLDETIQRQLEAVVQRIIKAAEKIEHAAEISERAGQHISQAAVFIEAEVKSALPSYTDLFRQWTEFQEIISSELDALRQRNTEPPKFRTLPRRQVVIERIVPTIEVESLLR